MRITVAAIGRLKDGPERELFDRYWDRFGALGKKLSFTPLKLVEMPESRASSADARKADEAKRLLASAQDNIIIALDENGKSITSAAFAQLLRKERDAGNSGLTFMIGGADGHGEQVLSSATLRLSLGAMTLPHGLARVVLAEQLYRAATIISGHPYHRV
jgi:23S rRNA (pseudouridine1915-N3)-methyltransferase